MCIRDSAYGVHKANNKEELRDALRDAFTFDDKVIVQQWIEGVELSVCILGSGWEDVYKRQGVAFMAAAACWWYFTARHSREAANVGLLPALIGSFGFAPLAPFAAGYLLRPRDAAATTLFAGCLLYTSRCV